MGLLEAETEIPDRARTAAFWRLKPTAHQKGVCVARDVEAAEPATGGTVAAAPPTVRSKVRRWYSFAAISLLNGVLLFLLVNLILYVGALVRHPGRSSAVVEQHYDPVALQKAYPGWKEEDVKELLRETWRWGYEYEYEPFTGFRERPFRGKFVNIDPAGFRFSKEQAPWPPRPDAINVFVFGGSTAFGFGLPDDQTIPSYVQECALANHSRPVAVYNFGRPAYFSSQDLILFQQLLNAGYVPQVAIFIHGLNDFIFSDGQPRFTEDLKRFVAGQVHSSPLDNLPLMRAAHSLMDRWTKPKPPKATDYADRVVLESVVNRWLANKRMIEVIADGFGVRPIFVWQPVPVYKYDLRYHFFLHSDKMFSGYGRSEFGYPLMQDLRAQGKLGPDMLWLADLQQDRHENLYIDAVHYTAAFSKALAARICGFMAENPQGAGQPLQAGP